MSTCVQWSPSSHATPSALAGVEQIPVTGSHAPAAWHASPAVQAAAPAPTHAPVPSQRSLGVHASSSLHGVPLGRLVGAEQIPVEGSQLPAVWQGLAGHTTALAPAQLPPWHASDCVQELPSSHALPGGSGWC